MSNGNPYGDPAELQKAFARKLRSTTGTIKKNVGEATAVSPEQSIEIDRLSRAYQVPSTLVSENVDTFKQRFEADKHITSDLPIRRPTLSSHLERPETARVVRGPDISNLHGAEWLFRSAQAAWGEGLLERADIGISMIANSATAAQRKRLQELNQQAASAFYGEEGWWESGWVELWRMMPLMGRVAAGSAGAGAAGYGAGFLLPVPGSGPTIAAGAAGVAAFGISAHAEAGLAMTEFVEVEADTGERIPYEIARNAAIMSGLVNGLLEVVGYRALLRGIPGGQKLVSAMTRKQIKKLLVQPGTWGVIQRFGRRYGETVFTEGGTEAAQEAFQLLMEAKAISEAGGEGAGFDMPTLSEAVRRSAGAGIAAMQAMSIGGLPGPTFHIATEAKTVARARGHQQFLADLSDNTKQSGLISKLPTLWRSIARDMAEAGELKNVYVEAGKLDEFFQSNDISKEDQAQYVPELKEQMESSRKHGTDVVIPLEVWAEKFASTAMEAQLRPHIRLSPEMPSLEEAEAADAAMTSDIKAQLDAIDEGVMAAREAAPEAFQVIKEDIRAKLEAAFPDFNRLQVETQAEGQAATVVAMAGRQGIEPVAWYRGPGGFDVRGPGGQLASAVADQREPAPSVPSAEEGAGAELYQDPAEMTDDEARTELEELETRYAGPGPGAAAFTPEKRAAIQPRIDTLKEKLGRHFWQRTQRGVARALGMPASKHRQYVEEALAEGKPVPPEVLAAYPDMLDDMFQGPPGADPYQSMTKAQQRVADKAISEDPNAERLTAAMERLAGTPWVRAVYAAALARGALGDLLEGKSPRYANPFNADKARELRELIRKKGEAGVWEFLDRADGNILGHPSKPINAVGASYLSCEPSLSCAIFCYAANGMYSIPYNVARSEVVEWAIQKDPVRAARIAARQYLTMPEAKIGKALRLLDKGDLSEQWIPFIKELNKQGVRVQVFSKHPELLRQVPAINLRLLSIDHSNAQLARDNPDLDVSVVYRGQEDLGLVLENRDRMGVILPVVIGSRTLTKEEVADIPKDLQRYLCPIDTGAKKIGKGKKQWNCTRCDTNGGIGCYHGRGSASLLSKAEEDLREVQDLGARVAEIRRIIRTYLPEHEQRLGAELDRVHAQIAAGYDIEADQGVGTGPEGRARQGDLGTVVAEEGGVRFETGRPVTFQFVRNPEPAPDMGDQFGQDIEPTGRYLLQGDAPPSGWQTGEVTFKRPLVISLGPPDAIYGPEGWKARLHDAYGGLSGLSLSRALVADGWDGIVTVDEAGFTSEVVDLAPVAALHQADQELFQGPPDDTSDVVAEGGAEFVDDGVQSETQVYVPEEVVALHPRVKLVKTGTMRTGIDRVEDPEDVAHVVASLRKDPQENHVTVVADKDGKVLGVVKTSLGTTNAALVHPVLALGGALGIPGAKQIWMVHNHPNDRALQSSEDADVDKRMAGILKGSGVVYRGSIVVTTGGKATVQRSGLIPEREFLIPPLARDRTVDVLQRRYRKIRTQGSAIMNQFDAYRVIGKIGKGKPGLLFLDGQRRPVGYLQMSVEEMKKLRSRDPETGIGAILRTASEGNAAAMIALVPYIMDRDAIYASNNLQNAGRAVGMTLLDVIDYDSNSEATTSNTFNATNSQEFFQGPAQVPMWHSKMARVFAEKLPGKGTAEGYLKTIQSWSKKGMFKAEELEWSGLEEWLESRGKDKLQRSEVLDFAREEGVQVTALRSGEGVGSGAQLDIEEKRRALEQAKHERAVLRNRARDALYDAHMMIGETSDVLSRILSDSWDRASRDTQPDPLLDFMDEDAGSAAARTYAWSRAEEVAPSFNWNQFHDVQLKVRDAARELMEAQDTARPTFSAEYEGWTLEGPRADYREVVLQLPRPSAQAQRKARVDYLDWALQDPNGPGLSEAEYEERIRLKAGDQYSAPIKSFSGGHFGASKELENTVAHYRSDIRESSDGKKIFFLEEIQSDWHQYGRDRGYRPPPGELPNGWTIVRDEAIIADTTGWEAVNEGEGQWRVIGRDGLALHLGTIDVSSAQEAIDHMAQVQGRPAAWILLNRSGIQQDDEVVPTKEEAIARFAKKDFGHIPDAPFKTSWPMLAFKHALRQAIIEGSDRIAWATGAQNAKHYNLINHVSRISWNPDNMELVGYDHGDHLVVDEVVDEGDLKDWVGIEIASKLIDQANDTRYMEEQFQVVDYPAEDVMDDGFRGKDLRERGYKALIDPNGEYVRDDDGVIMDYVQGDDARLHISEMANEGGIPTLSGLELDVGGEGMKTFYDEILPKAIKKYVKRWGGAVGETKVPDVSPGRAPLARLYRELRRLEGMPEYDSTLPSVFALPPDRYTPEIAAAKRRRHAAVIADVKADIAIAEASVAPTHTVHSVDITDEMRDAIKTQGQELFQPPVEPQSRSDMRAGIRFEEDGRAVITLAEKADLSSFLHEMGHMWLRRMHDMSLAPDATDQVKEDWKAIQKFLGLAPGEPIVDQAAADKARADLLKAEAAGDQEGVTKAIAAMTKANRRHEKFARAFEVFLGEGRSPSLLLERAFQRYARWLKKIYKSLTNLDVQMTDDIREVFGRMMASDEEIAQRMPGPTWAEKPDFVSEKEWERYLDLAARARGGAEDELRARLMASMAKSAREDAAEARERIQPQVEREINEQPVWRARHWLQTGEELIDAPEQPAEPGVEVEPELSALQSVPARKLDGPALEAQWEGMTKILPSGRYGLWQKDGGYHHDLVASWFGFTNAEEMVRELQATQGTRREDLIRRETEARVDRELGAPANEAEMEEAAEESMRTDAAARLIALEIRWLRRAGGMDILEKDAARRLSREAAESAEAVRGRVERAEQDLQEAIQRDDGEGATHARLRLHEAKAEQAQAARHRGDQKAAAARARGLTRDPRLIRDEARKHIEAQKIRDLSSREVIGKGGQPRRVSHHYSAAERRAGKRAAEAVARRDWEAAAKFKEQELWNHFLYRESRDGQEFVEKFLDYAKTFGGKAKRQRLAKAGAQFLPQIDTILSRFDLRRHPASDPRAVPRLPLEHWLEELAADTGQHLMMSPATSDETLQISYKDLRLEELRELFSDIRQLDEAGSQESREIRGAEQKTFDEQKSELLASINEHADSRRPMDSKIGTTRREDLGHWPAQFLAEHTKMEFLFLRLDGYGEQGAAWRHMFQPLADAEHVEMELKAKYFEWIRKVWQAYTPAERREWRYSRKHYDSLGQSLSKEEIFSLALNMGNVENKKAVTESYGWSEEDVMEALDDLDKRDWDTVQAIWDMIDSMWPEISALERRITGLAPKKVKASLVHTKHGSLPGGYYPLKYNPDATVRDHMREGKARASALNEESATKPVTQAGHRKARIGRARDQKVLLSLVTLSQHMDNALHDIAFTEAVINVNKLATDPEIFAAITETTSPEMYKQIRPWLQAIAQERMVDDAAIGKLFNWLRAGSTVANMGWKVSTTLAQTLGFFTTVDAIGVRYASQGLARALRDGRGVFRSKVGYVMEKSGQVKFRAETFDRDVRDTLRRFQTPDQFGYKLTKSFFQMIALVDMTIATGGWLGAYQKAMDGNVANLNMGDEVAAIAYADSILRRTQSAGGPVNLANIQRGGMWKRQFTMFYSFFSVLFNLFDQRVRQVKTSRISVPHFIASCFWLWFGPAVLGELLAGRGPDDDEEWIAWSAKELVKYPFSTIVIGRDLARFAVDDRRELELTPITDALEVTGKTARNLVQVAFTDEEWDRWKTKDIANTVGYWGRLPTKQIWITAQEFFDWMMGLDELELRDIFLAERWNERKRR